MFLWAALRVSVVSRTMGLVIWEAVIKRRERFHQLYHIRLAHLPTRQRRWQRQVRAPQARQVRARRRKVGAVTRVSSQIQRWRIQRRLPLYPANPALHRWLLLRRYRWRCYR